MGHPLRDMDKHQLLLEQIERVNALATANDITPLNLGPLARMALPAVQHKIHDKNNEVIAALDGNQIPWGGPLKDPAIAADVLDQSIDYTETLEGGGEEEPGDERPDWVPANATHHIDLVRAFNEQDAAWTAADGIVAVDTLLGADANTENGYGSTAYEPGLLTADGYVMSGPAVAFIGSARTKKLAGSTTVFKSKVLDAEVPALLTTVIIDDTGDNAIEIVASSSFNSVMGSSYGGDYSRGVGNFVNSGVVGAINVLAETLLPTRADLTFNGSDAVSDVLTEDDWPETLVAALFTCYGAMTSITLYDALPSTTGLSALSETGVTNTAPSAINVTWQAPATEVDATHATVSALLNSNTRIWASYAVVDAEGNPATWTLTEGDDKFVFDSFAGVIAYPDNLGPGVHTFTLRATDPGGLYVEQEFTITVTA